PNAPTRTLISARASRARNVGQTCGSGAAPMTHLPSLGGGPAGSPGPVLPGCPVQPGPGLDVSELLGQPLARRAAGQRAELPGQVSLVEVPAVPRQVRQEIIALPPPPPHP